MAQTYTLSGQLIVTNNNLRNIVTLQNNVTTTGSNSLANTMNVPTGAWQTIDQQSNSDFRFGFFTNLDLTSSLKIAIGNTGSYASLLLPGDNVILTNSGSASLYVQATGASSPALMQYVVSEK